MEKGNRNFNLIYAVWAIDESHVAIFDELFNLLGQKFKVIIDSTPDTIITGKTPFRRPQYEINYNENTSKAKEYFKNADVIIVGNTNKKIRSKSFKARNKLVFIEGERINKKNFSLFEKLKHNIGLFFHHKIYQRKNLLYLCIGSYVKQDLYEHNLYIDKCIDWGYWPKINDLANKEKKWDGKHINLVYVGQLIPIKRPEMCFEIAKTFEKNGFIVHLDFLGSGILLDQIKQIADTNPINGGVCVLGRVPLENVKQYLQNAHFYLSTSDYHDGWNMVINQSIQCGTPVISQEEVGSAKALITPKINGFLYDDKNIYEVIEDISSYIKNDYHKLLNFDKSFVSPKEKAIYLINTITKYL